jgi:hypothetical protein
MRLVWAGYVAHMEEMTKAKRVLIRIHDGKSLLGSFRRRWG